MTTTISAQQRDALTAAVHGTPDGTTLRITATAIHYNAAGEAISLTYVTVGPLHTDTKSGMRWVGETCIMLPIGGEHHLAMGVQHVERVRPLVAPVSTFEFTQAAIDAGMTVEPR